MNSLRLIKDGDGNHITYFLADRVQTKSGESLYFGRFTENKIKGGLYADFAFETTRNDWPTHLGLTEQHKIIDKYKLQFTLKDILKLVNRLSIEKYNKIEIL